MANQLNAPVAFNCSTIGSSTLIHKSRYHSHLLSLTDQSSVHSVQPPEQCWPCIDNYSPLAWLTLLTSRLIHFTTEQSVKRVLTRTVKSKNTFATGNKRHTVIVNGERERVDCSLHPVQARLFDVTGAIKNTGPQGYKLMMSLCVRESENYFTATPLFMLNISWHSQLCLTLVIFLSTTTCTLN